MTFIKRLILSKKYYSTAALRNINGQNFASDSYTNITPKVISRLNRKLFAQQEHPLCLIKERIIKFFYGRFKNTKGNPLFSVYEDLNPVVTTQQNFDSLLVPKDHPSRSKSDCYYINKECMLRAHMTAHQYDLIKMGLNNFLMVGDVYRRDDIDSTHYPTFHQVDGVRLLTPDELFVGMDAGSGRLSIKNEGISTRTKHSQEAYTEAATKKVEEELKRTLEDLTKDLFGKDIKYRWIEENFPFTHPSWELEIFLEQKWVEVLGCGVTEYKILENGEFHQGENNFNACSDLLDCELRFPPHCPGFTWSLSNNLSSSLFNFSAGCTDRIGWAFGLGLERLAMIYYSIPDIRIFWSEDRGFLNQFKGKNCTDKVTYKPVSVFPPCPFDLSFWISDSFDEQDFYELVRDFCNDLVERIEKIDVYKNPKTGRESRCYRLVYRSMERTLTKEELVVIHEKLSAEVVAKFNVEVR